MRTIRRFLAFGCCVILAQAVASVYGPGGFGTATDVARAQAQEADFESKKIVPFVPTPQEVVDKMLETAEVKKGDVVYDLGSGDGRIVITAARKYGVRAVGFEIDPDLIKKSRENIRKEGLQQLAEIRQQDILTVDVSGATVVTMYLLPDVNLQLRPTLLSQLKPGSRIVSHAFDMGDWKPDKVVQVNGRTVYLWTLPAKGMPKQERLRGRNPTAEQIMRLGEGKKPLIVDVRSREEYNESWPIKELSFS